MREVNRTHRLSNNIRVFCGKTVQDSFILLENFSKRSGIEFENYYVMYDNRTILAGYTKKEKLNGTTN